MDDLVEVTVRVHPTNVERLKAVATDLEIDFASASPELWHAVLEIANGDDSLARQILGMRVWHMGRRRLIDIALSGPDGLDIAVEYVGQLNAGVYS